MHACSGSGEGRRAEERKAARSIRRERPSSEETDREGRPRERLRTSCRSRPDLPEHVQRVLIARRSPGLWVRRRGGSSSGDGRGRRPRWSSPPDMRMRAPKSGRSSKRPSTPPPTVPSRGRRPAATAPRRGSSSPSTARPKPRVRQGQAVLVKKREKNKGTNSRQKQ